MATYDSNRFLEKRPMRGPGIGGGNVRVGYAYVDIPAGATSADSIRIMGIPANSTVLELKLRATSATTLNVGDVGDVDRFAAAQAVAANAVWAPGNAPTTGTPYTYPQVGPGIGNKNIVTAALTATQAADARLHVLIYFTVQEP